jgi:hypothetical protein
MPSTPRGCPTVPGGAHAAPLRALPLLLALAMLIPSLAHGTLTATVAPTLARIDSLGKAMRPTTTLQGAEDEARMVIARDAAGTAVREVQQAYGAALEATLPGLEPAQQEAARKQLDKQQEKGMKALREKLGGRGMGGPPRR